MDVGVDMDWDVEEGVDVELWKGANVEFSVIVAKGNIPNLIFQSIEGCGEEYSRALLSILQRLYCKEPGVDAVEESNNQVEDGGD